MDVSERSTLFLVTDVALRLECTHCREHRRVRMGFVQSVAGFGDGARAKFPQHRHYLEIAVGEMRIHRYPQVNTVAGVAVLSDYEGGLFVDLGGLLTTQYVELRCGTSQGESGWQHLRVACNFAAAFLSLVLNHGVYCAP